MPSPAFRRSAFPHSLTEIAPTRSVGARISRVETKVSVIVLDGKSLSIEQVAAIGAGAPVTLAPEGVERMRASRAVVERALAERRPVYGVTTGLGPRAVEALPEEELAVFARKTILGRAHAVGAPLSVPLVRGAMAVRLNTLLIGGAGASLKVAEVIRDCLNAGLAPVVGETASIGAADLLWGGTMGRALLGEGEIWLSGARVPAAEAFDKAGISPLDPGPRDGLAVASHSSFTGAIGAVGVQELRVAFEAAQTAAALSLEGFRGNPTPLDSRVISLRPQPGQAEAAEGLRARLAGSDLFTPGAPRRLQDPLSLRNAPQVHGAVWAALSHAEQGVTAEINGASDNPAVLAEDDTVISGGGYHTPHLAVCLHGLGYAWCHLAAMQCGRIARLLAARFSGLNPGLGAEDKAGTGMGPLLKVAEALMAEIAHLAATPPIYPSFSADGLEDSITHAAIPAKALISMAEKARLLVACELLTAAQAVELRDPPLGPAMAAAQARVRAIAPFMPGDTPMTEALESLAAAVGRGRFGDCHL